MFRLYLIWMPGCAVCAQTKPQARKWAEQHPWVKLVEFNLAEEEWKAKSWSPRIAPTLVLLDPAGRHHIREHGARLETITAWVKAVCPRALVPPRPSEAVVEPEPKIG